MKKQVLCFWLAVLMLLCIVPVSAASENVTIRGLHDAQVQRITLYALENGQPTGDNLLANATEETVDYSRQYRLSLRAGDYRLEGFDASGSLNGTLDLTVKDGNNDFTIQRVYDLHAANSGWQADRDYRMDVSLFKADGTKRVFSLGKADNYGTLCTSCLFLVGDTVDVTFVPLGAYADIYLPAHVSKTPSINCDIRATLYEGLDAAFITPAGSTVSVGSFSNYYVYDFYETTGVRTLADGRTETDFRIPKRRAGNTNGTNYFCRVQHPDGVTYWNYFDPAAMDGTAVEITADQLFLGNTDFRKDTVYHDFEQNTYDRAGIYLGGNKQGYLNLRSGETFELNAFRNWMAIESVYNAKVSLPDMHYTVIGMDGAASDVVTVTPDARNSNAATIRANHPGTAIVLVTYDAMFCEQAYVSGTFNKPCRFSAIWPENTGVLVFSVDADGSEIDTGMTLCGTGAGNEIDAEHDPLFYFGTEGADYTFTPESGCSISVNRSTVTDKMTFTGFSTDGVLQNADGSFTVQGLTSGKHIVRVEKDGKAAYQVLSAYKASLQKSSETIRTEGTAEIQFSGLVNPVEKMSGIYNNSARIRYVGSDGTVFLSPLGGQFGVYDFSSSQKQQHITVTLPRYYAGDTYTLSGGVIAMNLSGSAPGSHRGVSYGKGMDPGFNAQNSGALQGNLPDITFRVEKADYLTGTLTLTDQEGNAVPRDAVTITLTDADGFETAVQADGSFLCLAGEYTYSITGEGFEEATGTITVTSGETHTVTLQRTKTPSKWEQFSEKLSAFFGRAWQVLSRPFRLLVQWIQKLLKK